MLKINSCYICLLMFCVVVATIMSCSKSKAEQPILSDSSFCDSIVISYVNDVMPILQSNCYVCHNSSFSSGGHNWSSYSEVSSKVNRIICAINHNSECFSMPRFADKLADSVIKKIECWAVQGALNN